MKARFTLGRKERLKSRKQLDLLFAKGLNFRHHPLRLYYISTAAKTDEVILQAGVGAPTRAFKKAVDRNRIKRQLRECYRTQKELLQKYCDQNQTSLALFILYTGREIPETAVLKEKLSQALKKLIQHLDEAAKTNT